MGTAVRLDVLNDSTHSHRELINSAAPKMVFFRGFLIRISGDSWGKDGMSNRLIRAAMAMVLAGVLTQAAHGQAGGKDPIEDAVEAFDKQIGIAKKQFDTSVARSADTTLKRLITLGDNAARNKNDDFASRAFKEALRIDRSSSQARSFFQQRNKLDAVLSELTLEWHPLVLLAPEGREERVFYECMLGKYQSDRTWIAAVTMVVPD